MNGDELAPGPGSAQSDAADGPATASEGAPASASAPEGSDDDSGIGGTDPRAGGSGDAEENGFAAPFVARSFGGEFVWADAESYTAKILRVKPGEKVVVSTRGRRDMVAMLTGGRAVLEVLQGDEVDRVEMMPAAPVAISPDAEYRLVALTEVELFTIYTVL